MGLVYKISNLQFMEDGSNAFPWAVEMTLPIKPKRLPAEWEKQSAILMALPHPETDWNYMLDEVQECYKNIIKSISSSEKLIIAAPDINYAKRILADVENDSIIYFEVPTNDTWARDFGAITTETKNGFEIIDFKFNGWGLKFASDKDNLVTISMNQNNIFNGSYNNQLSFVLEGGSIESDGNGTIMTTSECLLSKNRNGNFAKMDIEEYIKWIFGAKRVLWIENGYLRGDDTDSHVDTLARFINETTIAYVKCEDVNDEHFEELRKMEEQIKSFRTLKNEPYNTVALPMPDSIFDEDGNRLPATYANFLIMNDKVLVPIYGQKEKDEEALNKLQAAFHKNKVIGIDCNALIKQHGSLHCVTMQFPYGSINNEIING